MEFTRTAPENMVCGLDWTLRQAWPKPHRKPTRVVSVVDLFCGCGGLTLGIYEALRVKGHKMQITLAVDNSHEALKVYSNNFHLKKTSAIEADIVSILPGDIGTEIQDPELKIQKLYSGIDILVAGPPCQGHSDLNNNTRRDDPRNKLYLKVIRFVEITRPRVVLVENVPAAIHDTTAVVDKSKRALSKLGYKTKSMFVRALNVGLPQTRKRHVLIAVDNEDFEADNFILDEQEHVNLKAYIHDIMDEFHVKSGLYYTPSAMNEVNKRRVQYLFDHKLYDLPNSERPDCHRTKQHSYISMYGRLNWDKPAQTITSGFGCMGQGRFVHPERQRTLTPHEAARIQGFPDFYDFSSVKQRTALHEMIGNAVPPRIAAMIVVKLLDQGIL